MGYWAGRMVVVAIGAVFFLSSALIVLYWRWYRRTLDDIAATRRILSEEAREMQRLLGKR